MLKVLLILMLELMFLLLLKLMFILILKLMLEWAWSASWQEHSIGSISFLLPPFLPRY